MRYVISLRRVMPGSPKVFDILDLRNDKILLDTLKCKCGVCWSCWAGDCPPPESNCRTQLGGLQIEWHRYNDRSP